MKATIIGNYHHKNLEFLNWFINKNFEHVNNINEADIIFSGNQFIDIENYPDKKFIFGPHFSVFPNKIVKRFNNSHKNGIYIQPSQPSVNTWQKEFSFNSLPMKAMAFGVNTNKFKQLNNIKKDNIFLYYKDRDPNELVLLKKFLQDQNINYKFFSYMERYTEQDFLSYIQSCKYGIWLGCHESQGFALEESLSCDVPLLVWTVKLRIQQYSMRDVYKNVKSPVTSIPYWDNNCGEYFEEENELEETFSKFINNLEKYEPRKFVIENISMEACEKNFLNLIHNWDDFQV